MRWCTYGLCPDTELDRRHFATNLLGVKVSAIHWRWRPHQSLFKCIPPFNSILAGLLESIQSNLLPSSFAFLPRSTS